MASLVYIIIIQHNLHCLTKSKTITNPNLPWFFAQPRSHITFQSFSTFPPNSTPSDQAAFRIQTCPEPQSPRLFARKSDCHLSQHGQLRLLFLRRLPQHLSWLGSTVLWLRRFGRLCNKILELLQLQYYEQCDIGQG